MERIVIATDGSKAAQHAAEEALELARETGAVVTFVTVRQPISLLGAPYYQTELTRQLAPARAALDGARREAEARGINADYEILEGDPAREILAIARARDAELIVVGSRGLGTMAGALLGSVSRAVVRDADRPVLVVKEPGVAAAREEPNGNRSAAARS
jgi:nucleotide-binding universal stress UspA family protein